jgi:hypothetical protein
VCCQVSHICGELVAQACIPDHAIEQLVVVVMQRRWVDRWLEISDGDGPIAGRGQAS